MTWKIESFEPSDGTRVAGCVIDHLAWLKRADGVHISLNIASNTVPADEAHAMLDAMVRGLNGLANA